MQTQGKQMAWQLLIRTVESCDVEVCYLNSPAIGITSERVSFTYFYILQFILLSSFLAYFKLPSIYLIRTNFRGHLILRIWNTNISRALFFAILQKMIN